MNTLHLIDCMEYMKDIPDNTFDLIIVDPPYGIKIGGNKPFGKRGFAKAGKNKIVDAVEYHTFDDTKPPSKDYFNQLMRISKNQIIWGGNYFIDKLYSTSCMIVWDKNNSGNFADCELAWTSFKTAVRKFKYTWNGLLQENMKNKENRIHPTQKPVALYKWLLTNYAKPGDKLFDSHSGSGSFRIAAYDMGFDLISCELDPDYCRDNEARFQRHIQQQELFPHKEIQEKIYVDKELFDD